VSGFDPITIAGDCPVQEDTAELVIDGSAYTAGAATITLYQCTGGSNTGFHPLRIKLENFLPGLWFEIVNRDGETDLVIKSLADYDEYWIKQYRWCPSNGDCVVSGEYDEQSSTVHFPSWSWHNISRFIKARKNPNQEWTEQEFESMATKNYITYYGLGARDKVVERAESIKNHSADIKFLFYWNSETKWGEQIPGYNSAWGLPGSSATGARDSLLYDHSIQEMRQWWVEYARLMDSEPIIDGVYADATRITVDQFSPTLIQDPYDLSKSEMIKDLAESLPATSLKLGNFIRQKDPDGNRFRMQYEDGSYFENQHVGENQNAWKFSNPTRNFNKKEPKIVSMQLAREASWKRKIVLWNGAKRNCGCAPLVKTGEGKTPDACIGWTTDVTTDEMPAQGHEDLQVALAEYLMVAEEYSYVNFQVRPVAEGGMLLSGACCCVRCHPC